MENPGESRIDAVGRRTGAQPADHAQPRAHGLPKQGGLAGDHRLFLEWNPEIRRIGAKRLAEEARRRHADDGERVTFDDKRGAQDGRIAAVRALPRVMTQHEDGRRGRRIVLWRDAASDERGHAERREVVAGDVT